ncbi:anti-repressor SinI family protein [Aquibacillus saliphilus]|uniref:anti-repressor SinI family protein n=1 Tax=Aquibacillus saliphilus TaxID=1909422 RepID=UPI001CEFB7FE|nr:anti-repressor SinI family protein [Aquibacillus saliphilus]
MSNKNSTNPHRHYDEDWLDLMLLAKKAGLTTTEVRRFLEQKELKKKSTDLKVH